MGFAPSSIWRHSALLSKSNQEFLIRLEIRKSKKSGKARNQEKQEIRKSKKSGNAGKS